MGSDSKIQFKEERKEKTEPIFLNGARRWIWDKLSLRFVGCQIELVYKLLSGEAESLPRELETTNSLIQLVIVLIKLASRYISNQRPSARYLGANIREEKDKTNSAILFLIVQPCPWVYLVSLHRESSLVLRSKIVFSFYLQQYSSFGSEWGTQNGIANSIKFPINRPESHACLQTILVYMQMDQSTQIWPKILVSYHAKRNIFFQNVRTSTNQKTSIYLKYIF